MLHYILRRTWQMVPTVFGVILITFVLFNIAGGDLATQTLGKHVSAKLLEEFDEQRGFNRPLLFGRWARTRAHADTSFEQNAGIWNAVDGVEYRPADRDRGRLVLPMGGLYPVPVAFSLRASEHQWTVTYRLAAGGRARLMASGGGEEGGETALSELPVSPSWRTARIRFDATQVAASASYVWRVEGAPLELASLKLRRRVDSPLDSQLVFYLKQLARLDFGISSSSNQRVSKLILEGMLPSLALAVPVFFVEIAVAISLSLVCAFFRDRFVDRFFVLLSVALMSLNYIVWIIVGQFVLGFRLGWFPVWGFESWRYLLLPVVIGIVSGLGTSVRFYRTIMLDEMYKDYVRTAFAKGVSRSGVLFRHVLKNAMIPIITNVVIAIPFLYTGMLLMESFFGIPGLGYMAINAINSSDVDVIRAIVFVGSVTFVVANLVTDLCYALADPRVKLQ